MPRPFGAVPTILNSTASPINVALLDQNWAQLLTDFNDSSIGYTNWGVDTGIANAYSVTIAGPLSSYATGMVIAFSPANTNTGASTVNVNGVGTVSILDVLGNTPQPGEILAGRTTYLVYNGTVFLLVNSSITGGVSYSYDWDDLMGNPKFLVPTNSGTGSSSTRYVNQIVGHPGLWQLITGTVSGTFGTLQSAAVFLDAFTWTIRSIWEPSTIGTSANLIFGFDSSPGSPLTNRTGIFIFGAQGTANYQFRCGSGASVTQIDSGIAFSVGVMHDFEIIGNTGSVAFYIDGALITTITTNIPASTSAMNFGLFAATGSGQSAIIADTFEYLINGIPQLGLNQRFLRGAV
jgi:hypothetical protein